MKLKSNKFIDTPSQTAGPFLHIGCTPKMNGIEVFKNNIGDLPFDKLTLDKKIRIRGKVFDGANQPLKDALIETWQCNEKGKFNNQFGFCRRATNFKTGEYEIETIKPGSFLKKDGTFQSPFILFFIFARGLNRPLITKMFFSKNEILTDIIFKKFQEKNRLLTLLPRIENSNDFIFNIYIQGKKETIFFDF